MREEDREAVAAGPAKIRLMHLVDYCKSSDYLLVLNASI